ncbi:MAG TPA: hypothetical protein VHS96_04030 [Bacteroidia bacterium]|nr:hypothetical protein [Bacteroidia bacterium]
MRIACMVRPRGILIYLFLFLVWIIVQTNFDAAAQQTISIHFLYGSKPAKGFRGSEPRWFGGKRGGHVGLEIAPDQVLNFGPTGKFHWVSNHGKRHSRFTEQSVGETLMLLGKSEGRLQTLSIQITIDSANYAQLLDIRNRYLQAPPYDYAFIGMRCASATDEILAKIGLTKQRGYWGTVLHTFRPRALRTRLLRKAEVYGWKVSRQLGSERRVWEKDRK